ncbi:LOW QUALITY PROTEIN: mas-related G-protein coupled receptor member B4-like [Peromyscus eremicus]|uniref:LOW QUALITY PROTEIN: mas-related G-protein coupled receptor member B4-like n=1 Tax=Peromyscus eremicus TaxID=42410 RepID=UPI0027DDB827|nr:LOW QUALITY PROTEIN: mas-related G-protein coupled receptor member B4-like [Peromyscus eremicus]
MACARISHIPTPEKELQPWNGKTPGGLDRKFHVFISQFLCRNTSGNFSSVGPSIPAWITDNNTTMNRSYYTGNLHCDTMYKIFNILAVIICVVGLAGNAIVLWLLGFHVHRNAFSVYVLNLAGADFLYLCFQTVFFLRQILSLFDVSYFHIPYFTHILIFAYLAGLCMITVISVERCLSVLWPIWYHCKRPRYMSSVVCALLWAFTLLLSLLWFVCSLLLSDYNYYFCWTVALSTFVFITVLSVFPCVFNLALLVRIFCGSQRIPVTRLYVTIALTVLVFLLFGLPFGMYWIIFLSSGKWPSVFSCNSYILTSFLSCVNSCANPIIYFLVGSIRHCRFQRQSLKILLQRAMQDTPEKEDGEKGSSGNTGQQETALCSS